MKKSFYVVANWKTYLSYRQSLELFLALQEKILSMHLCHHLIVCPPTSALAGIASIYTPSQNIHLGSQTCSAYEQGAHTGDVDAQSLKELNYAYSIVGHSERRKTYGETDEMIAQQAYQLVTHGLTPIICIGEPVRMNALADIYAILQHQLETVLTKITPLIRSKLFIAYEPAWAIGTDMLPNFSDIQEIFSFLQKMVSACISQHSCVFLYGGSVNVERLKSLKHISLVDGFLVGRASTDFTQLQELLENSDSE